MVCDAQPTTDKYESPSYSYFCLISNNNNNNKYETKHVHHDDI